MDQSYWFPRRFIWVSSFVVIVQISHPSNLHNLSHLMHPDK